MHEHKCDKIKCGNCNKYVGKDHQCYAEEKIKPHSEKLVFFDFETKLDSHKHVTRSKLLCCSRL